MSSTIVNKVNIFVALLAITAIQISLSYFNGLDPVGHIIAALLLGVSETMLVGIFFMGLKNEQRLIKVTALFPFLLFCIMNGAVILDVLIFTKH
jgi:caa(3)-type oxidase subunit IV